jgi:CBS domain-containing protein
MTTTTSSFPALGSMPVSEAMHLGLISCSFESSLRTAATLMATHRVHAILVTAHGEDRLPDGGPWAIVTDADLLRAAETADLDEVSVRTIATMPVHTVATNEPLTSAAELMAKQNVSHVVVIEPRSSRPLGVLSTLDVARALARFPERHPAGRS